MSRRPTSTKPNRSKSRGSDERAATSDVETSDQSSPESPRPKKPTRWWFVLGGVAVLLVMIGLFVPKAIRDYSLLQTQQALTIRDYESAISWLDFAEQVAPNDGEIAFMKARTYRKMGDFEEFDEWLGAARLNEYSKERCRREEWLLHAQTGQLTKAGPHLEELLDDEFQDYAEVMEAFASGYLLSGRPQTAREFIEPWEESIPEDPLAKVLRGIVEWESGKTDSALKRFRDALEIKSDFVPAKMALADSLSRQGSYEEAIPLLRDCLESENFKIDARNKLAVCLRETGKLEEAVTLLEEALEINRNSFTSYLELAKTKQAQQDNAAARDALAKALELQPNDSETHQVLAEVLRAMGEPNQAEAHEAFAAEAVRMREQASALIEELAKETDESETRAMRVRIGRILMRYGNEQEGTDWVLTALSIDPDYQPAHAALADFFERKALTDPRYQAVVEQYREQAQGYQLPPLTSF